MSARWLSVLGSAMVVLGLAEQLSAEILATACNSIATDVKRRQCWPEPFAGPDRASVRAPLAKQVANGWRRQNMLGEFHFDEGGQLNEAGRNKVRWILTSCPQQHRLIYVHTAEKSEDTANRMASVQQLAAEVTPSNIPPIMFTSIADNSWPADQVDAIGRAYMKTIAEKVRLPAASSGDTSAGTAAK